MKETLNIIFVLHRNAHRESHAFATNFTSIGITRKVYFVHIHAAFGGYRGHHCADKSRIITAGSPMAARREPIVAALPKRPAAFVAAASERRLRGNKRCASGKIILAICVPTSAAIFRDVVVKPLWIYGDASGCIVGELENVSVVETIGPLSM
jgi:hypothetical protein